MNGNEAILLYNDKMKLLIKGGYVEIYNNYEISVFMKYAMKINIIDTKVKVHKITKEKEQSE